MSTKRQLTPVHECPMQVQAHTRWDRKTRSEVPVPTAEYRVLLRIDVEALALELGYRASEAKGRRASAKRGLIVAQVFEQPSQGSDGHLERALASGD